MTAGEHLAHEDDGTGWCHACFGPHALCQHRLLLVPAPLAAS